MTITLLPRITVDFLLLMKDLLSYDGLRVVPMVDVDTFDDLDDEPLLAYAGMNGHMIRNGYPGAGWEWTLLLDLFTVGLADASGVGDTVYQIVHSMEGRPSDYGQVSSVEDVAMFDRIGGATLPDKRIAHLNASFTVRVRP